MSRHNMQSSSGAGFTIVELLVVIAIIAVLASLLLPAVNGARESARNATCQNNMRNLGLAIQQYETRFQKYPPAFVDPEVTGKDGYGMMVFVLPFLEESAIYDRINLQEEDWNSAANEIVTKQIPITGMLYCPSSPRTRQYKVAGNLFTRDVDELQSTDYSPSHRLNGNQDASTSYGPGGEFVLKGLKTLIDNGRISTAKRGPYAPTNPAWQGIMQGFLTWKQSNVRSANVRDGLSTTFLLFETAGRPEHHYAGKKDRDIRQDSSFRWAGPAASIAIDRTCDQGAVINCHNYDEVYAFHPGGANIVNADGSIRLLNDQIDPEVFVSLYTMAGGDRVSESALE